MTTDEVRLRFFRIYWKRAGGHTHTRWFSGADPKTVFGKCGDLTFVNDEWDTLRAILQHSNVQFIEESTK